MGFVQKRRCLVSFCVLVGLVVWILCGPEAAQAQAGEGPAAPGVEKESWYGWQTMIAGGASLMLPLFLLIPDQNSTEEEAILVTSSLGHSFGGPIVHWSHKALGKGFASLGINVVGVTAGLFLGVAASGKDLSDAFYGAITGAYVGGVAAILVDSLWLAYEPVTAPEGTSFNIGLSVGLNGLSVVGQF